MRRQRHPKAQIQEIRMPVASLARNTPMLVIAFVGIAAFAVGASTTLWRAPAPGAHAQEACAQPSESGCPMELQTPVGAALNDGTTTHNWLLNVTNDLNFTVALTNLYADFQLWVYGPDNSLLGLSNNPSTQDELLIIGNIGTGTYWIVVDSPSGEASEEPYTLVATAAPAPAPPVPGATPSTLSPYGTPLPRIILPY